jgi:RHS repeat-associated protein
VSRLHKRGATAWRAVILTAVSALFLGTLVVAPAVAHAAGPTAPGAPTAVKATPGNAQATVTWTAPATGGSPITAYTVTSSPGGFTAATTGAKTATVTGLSNGTAYTFTVTATNIVGTGPASAASAPVTPAASPGAPTGVAATAGNAKAVVTWTAPTDNGGSAITGYTVTASPGGATATTTGATSATVNGLTNGTAYTFMVTAKNAVSTGPSSAPSGAITPAGPPGSPTGVAAVAGNAQATVSWTAPASNGGSAITGYTVTSSPGGKTATTTGATSAIVGTLTNGTAYTFTVKATTAAGTSAASAASTAVTPTGPPGAPTSVSAVAGDGQATVAWNAPASNGGLTITGYTVTSSPDGLTATTTGATTATVVGLTDGTAYTFTVVATNADGAGATSTASASITPLGPPSAPTGVTATPGNAKVVVSWTPPTSNGGSPVTGYTVTASPGGQTATAGGAATSATVTGLTNGTSYTFTVTAKNSRVTGAASAPSASVVPAAPPGAPTGVVAVPGNGQATVSWTAPASNGGSPIISYTVTSAPGGLVATTTGATSVTVTGLTNGTAYTFKVVAANAVSSSASSAASTAVTPLGAPGTPSNVAAAPGNGQATVSWSKPASNGGSAITAYTVTASPGGITATTTGATTVTVTGLTNGTAYTFTVTATNAQGTSASSVASAPVTPAMLPGAPSGVHATAGNASATVSWTAPTSDGGSPITGYTVTASPGNSKTTTTGATSVTVTGLTNATAYTFKVTATNAIGTGPSSTASAAVTPTGPPAPPTGVTATPGNGQAGVSWTAPTSNGGSPITGYTVIASPGGLTATTGLVTSVVVAGLTNGTAYTFTVEAINALGTGAPSAPSASVTPVGAPYAPTSVAALANDSQAIVSWTAAPNGGSPITKYTVTAQPGGATETTAGATDLTFIGLTDGTAYTFTVTATNALGTSPASAPSAPVTPGGATLSLPGGVAQISEAFGGFGSYPVAISADAHFALVVDPRDPATLYLRDNETGTASNVTTVASGGQFMPGAAVSSDGRYVTYGVLQGPGDTIVYQRDMATGVTTTISPDMSRNTNSPGGYNSAGVAASGDGGYVAYVDPDLASGCAAGLDVAVVWSRATNSTTQIPGCVYNGAIAISADASTIAFYAPDGNTDGYFAGGVFAWSRTNNASLGEISLGHAGAKLQVRPDSTLSLTADGTQIAFAARITPDGKFIYTTDSSTYQDGAATAIRNVTTGITYAVPYPATQLSGNVYSNDTSVSPSISTDGRHVAYLFEPGTGNEGGSPLQVLVADMKTGTVQRADVTTALRVPNSGAESAFLSADGRYVAFESFASNIVPGDTNGNVDAFLRDTRTLPPIIPAGEVRPGDAFCPVCQATADRLDPINTATGAYENNATDVSLPGAGVTFNLAREYSSDNTAIGEFGIGWQANLTASLTVLADGDAQINAGTGADVIFHAQPDGTFVAPPEVRATLTQLGNGDWQLATNTQVVSLFDSNGRLISQVDRTGLGLTYAYDGSGNLTSVTDAEGRVTTFTRGTTDAANGLITAVHVSDGRSWAYSYAYATDGTTPTLTSVTDPSAGVTTYTYDDAAQLATVTDPNGHQVVAVSYSNGQVSSLSEAASGTPGYYSWNSNTGTAVTTDARGGSWSDTYIGNELTSETDPLGDTTQYRYDSSGNKTEVIDPDGNTTTFTYDANGNVLTQTDPLGGVTTSTYDANNNLLSQTDPLGRTTSYTYDTSGQKTSEADPAGGVWHWTYSATGQQASQTDPNGNVTSYTYDTAGNQISKTDPMRRVTTYTYDSSGNQLTQTDPMGRTTTDTYDSLGRLLTETDPLGRETVNTYDSVGNLATVTTAAGTPQAATTTNTYDAANRLLKTTDPLGRVTTNAYDAAGSLVSTTDPAGDVTSYTYDLAGRKVGVTRPNGNVTGADPSLFTMTYSFDPAGHQIGTSQPLGGGATAVTSVAYDADGRVMVSTDADGNVTHNAYDADGELTQVTDPTGAVTTNTYDPLGRRISTTDPLGRTSSFGYDADGNQTSMTDPTGAIMTAMFDADSEQVTQVAADGNASGASASDFTTTYGYDADGEQTSLTDPLGHTSTTTYDADGEKTQTTDATSASTSYTYDAAGNQTMTTNPDGTTITDGFDLAGQMVSSADAAGHTTTDAYNPAGRLISSTDPTGAVTMSTFDANGNQLTSTSPNGGVTTNVYDPADRLISSTSPTGGVTTYSYDANGKQTSTTDADGNTTGTTFDADGRPVVTTRPDGTTVTSAYDAAGELTSYTEPYNAAPGSTPSATVAAPVAAPAAPAAPADPTTVAVVTGSNAVTATWVTPSGGAPADYQVSVSAGTQLLGAIVVAGSATSASVVGLPAGAADVLTVQPAGGGAPMLSASFAITGAASTYSSQVLADAPGVYYRLGDGVGADAAADSSGHGNTATATPTGVTFGEPGVVATDTDTAAGFATGSLQATSGANLPVGNTDRSVEAWFATSSAGDQVIASWGTAGPGEQFTLAVDGGNQIVLDADGQTATFTAASSFADGKFHQVVLTYAGATNAVIGYLDGQLIGADTLTTPLSTTVDSSGLTIGASSGSSNNFTGNLDEVAIYPSALTPARVQAHFSAAQLAGLSTTTYTYDGAARKATETDPDAHVTHYNYDASGNPTSTVDASGRVTTQTFDAASRLTGIVYSDGVTPNVTYNYDAAGRRTSMHDGTGTTSYTYNTSKQLTAVSNGAGNAVGYGYDSLGRINAITYPDGHAIARGYDAASRFASVTDWNSHTTTFGYDGDGNLTSTTLPNGVVQATTVNASDQTTGISVGHGGTSLASFGYTLTPAGQVAGINDSLAPTTANTYGYSPNHQLVGQNGDATAYSYDGSGNLTSLDDGSALSYDPAGRLTNSQPGEAGVQTAYSFNAVGDRTGSATGAASITFGYDQAQRLTHYASSTLTQTYSYNGDGLRTTSTTSGGGTSSYTWDLASGGLALLLSDGPNEYLYGPHNEPIEEVATSTGTTTYLSQDAIGSTRLVTDSSGVVVGAYSYDPYGRVVTHTGSVTTALGYTGEYTDPTGLLYLRARYYDPATGQMLTIDPYVDQTHARYAYANDDPTDQVDPSGRVPLPCAAGGSSTFNDPLTLVFAGSNPVAEYTVSVKTVLVVQGRLGRSTVVFTSNGDAVGMSLVDANGVGVSLSQKWDLYGASLSGRLGTNSLGKIGKTSVSETSGFQKDGAIYIRGTASTPVTIDRQPMAVNNNVEAEMWLRPKPPWWKAPVYGLGLAALSVLTLVSLGSDAEVTAPAAVALTGWATA